MATILISALGGGVACDTDSSRSAVAAPTLEPESEVTPKATLPPYTIESVDPLLPKRGSRVRINAANDITDEDCANIIGAERGKGGPDGQVSVHIPMPNDPEEYLPLCIENFDGEGVRKGVARQMIEALAMKDAGPSKAQPPIGRSNKTKLNAKVVKVVGDDVYVVFDSNLPAGAKLAVSLDFIFKIDEGGPVGRGVFETVQSCYSSLKDRVTGPQTRLILQCAQSELKRLIDGPAWADNRILRYPKTARLKVGFYPRWGLDDVPNAGNWSKQSVKVKTKIRWRR